MRKTTGPVSYCLVQMLLEYKKISTITPTELGRMMNISANSAGLILTGLSWRRERLRSGHTIYHYEGRDKVFSRSVVWQARKRLARLLGVPKEELMGVLA